MWGKEILIFIFDFFIPSKSEKNTFLRDFGFFILFLIRKVSKTENWQGAY